MNPPASAAVSVSALSVGTIAQLRALPRPTTPDVVSVAGHTTPGDGGGGSFRFDLLSWAPDNNGTVIAPVPSLRGRWRRIYDQDVSVKWFGARGDNRTPDTNAIQAAVNVLRPGDTLHFPPGSYRIRSDRGVSLKSDTRVDLGTATLVGANVDGARCRLLSIEGRRNIQIVGGTLVGSRLGSPEWGVGILVSDSESVSIDNVYLSSFFLDGILVTGNQGCNRIFVRGCASVNNRRTGLAVVSATSVVVEDSVFQGNYGQSPQAGANFEPSSGGEVRAVFIRRCTFRSNAGVGLYVHKGLGDAVSNVTLEDNLVQGNDQGIVAAGIDGVAVVNNYVWGHRGRAKSGIAVGATTTKTVISGNNMWDNFRGIISIGTVGADIRKNIVVGTGPIPGLGQGVDGDGIVCRGQTAPLPNACLVYSNIVRKCAGVGIATLLVSNIRVLGNVIENTGQAGLSLAHTSSSEVRGNTISKIGLEAPRQYDVVAVKQFSNANLIIANVLRLGTTARNAIGIGADCKDNQVTGNVVVQ